MGLGCDALAGRLFFPAPATEPSARPELVATRRQVRGSRTVTILRIPRLWPALQVGRLSPTAPTPMLASRATAPADGLDAFGSEADPVATPPKGRVASPPPPLRPKRPLTVPKWAPAAAKWAAVILLTAATAIAGVFLYQKRLARAVTTGTVTLETTPSGLDVVLAGKSVGKTPLTTTLAAGSYDVQVGTAPNTRTIKVNVTAGTSVVQHVEIADALATAAVTTGGLHEWRTSRASPNAAYPARGWGRVSRRSADAGSNARHQPGRRAACGRVVVAGRRIGGIAERTGRKFVHDRGSGQAQR